jgi:hypothetical protein
MGCGNRECAVRRLVVITSLGSAASVALALWEDCARSYVETPEGAVFACVTGSPRSGVLLHHRAFDYGRGSAVSLTVVVELWLLHAIPFLKWSLVTGRNVNVAADRRESCCVQRQIWSTHLQESRRRSWMVCRRSGSRHLATEGFPQRKTGAIVRRTPPDCNANISAVKLDV